MQPLHVAAQYFLNHRLDPEEIRHQVRLLAEAGFECIYPHARAGLETPYLSENWFEIIDLLTDECRKHGTTAAIWDEDYFPSPDAGNRVVWEQPNHRAQYLTFSIFPVVGGSCFFKVFDPAATVLRCFAVGSDGTILDITSHTGSLRRNWRPRAYRLHAYSNSRKIAAPHRRTSLSERRFGVLWQAPPGQDYRLVAVQVQRSGDNGHSSDILNAEAIDAFLGCTHEAYRQRYGSEFSERFAAAFCDEPAPTGAFPWTGRFREEFLQEHGYDLLPRLPHLVLDVGDETPMVRHHYRLTQMRLQCVNYLARMRQWCGENGIASIGHLTRTEWLSLAARTWPQELRCCMHLDLPCTDPLGFHVALPDAAAYHTGIKVVVSAARLFNKEQAGSDALAVMGNEVALRDLAFQLDYQLALGITYFNIHGLVYSLDGPRKDEAPPSLFYQHSEWPIMRELLAPLAGKCRRLTEGQPVRRLLVLHPATTLYCDFDGTNMDSCRDHPLEAAMHDLAETLLSRHQDFDLIDEITLAERPVETLRRDYDVLLMYGLAWIDAATAEASERFADAGGSVVVCGRVPPRLLGKPDAPQPVWERGAEFLTHTLPERLPGLCLTGTGAQHVFVHERCLPECKRRFFLFNRAEQPFAGELEGRRVRVPPKGACFLEDLPEKPLETREYCQLSDFNLSFPDNILPLPCWTVHSEATGKADADFLSRDIPTVQGETAYECPFLLQGTVSSMRLVVETGAFAGRWSCFVNDREIGPFHSDPVIDCNNLSADITGLLITDTVPRLNRIRMVCENGLHEMPWLQGSFAAFFRHGRPMLPQVYATSSPIKIQGLCGWQDLGYGSFAGCGIYETAFRVECAGEYRLDCGRVEDAVEMIVDARRIGCRIQPPYALDTGHLSCGSHKLTLRVWNGPGNRDRLSGLPAGLYGPVRLSIARRSPDGR